MEKKPPAGQRIVDAIRRSAKLHGLHGTANFTPKETAAREAARNKLLTAVLTRARELGDVGDLDDGALARVVDEIAPDPFPAVPVSEGSRAALANGLEWDPESTAIWETGTDDITRNSARPEILGWFARGILGEVEREFGVVFLPPDVLAIREELRQLLEGERRRSRTQAAHARPAVAPQTEYPRGDDRWLRGLNGELLHRVTFHRAEGYLGINPRQRQSLTKRGVLVRDGAGFVTVKSLLARLPQPAASEKKAH